MVGFHTQTVPFPHSRVGEDGFKHVLQAMLLQYNPDKFGVCIADDYDVHMVCVALCLYDLHGFKSQSTI